MVYSSTKRALLLLGNFFLCFSFGEYVSAFLLPSTRDFKANSQINRLQQISLQKRSSKLNMLSPVDFTDIFNGNSIESLQHSWSQSIISMNDVTLNEVFGNIIAQDGDGETTYSKYSYYTTLGLYLLSFPGLISLITRSVKAKNISKIYEINGPNAKEDAKPAKLVAGEIMAYFKANNYEIGTNEGEEIIFKGIIGRSKSQAFFLSFCTFIGLGSLALVLSIQFQDIGQKFFYMTLLSPYAGFYYWNRASREDEARVRLEVSDNEEKIEVSLIATKEEQERFSSALKYDEKGMIRVKGIFESESAPSIN